jgi:general secretion pathway protein C
LQKAAFLSTLAALALLATVLAYWSWAVLAPQPAPRAPAAEAVAANAGAAAALFGSAPQGRGAVSGGPVRLLGVVAASSGAHGHAVLRLDAKRTVAVLEGAEIEPGLRLAEVHVDHIVLERNGARETLAWPEKKSR